MTSLQKWLAGMPSPEPDESSTPYEPRYFDGIGELHYPEPHELGAFEVKPPPGMLLVPRARRRNEVEGSIGVSGVFPPLVLLTRPKTKASARQ